MNDRSGRNGESRVIEIGDLLHRNEVKGVRKSLLEEQTILPRENVPGYPELKEVAGNPARHKAKVVYCAKTLHVFRDAGLLAGNVLHPCRAG